MGFTGATWPQGNDVLVFVDVFTARQLYQFGGNNRTHMVRIPDRGRIEFRLADVAADPYLLMAGILAGGDERHG